MRIGLIHAVQVAIEPINTALQQQWPEAECMNVLDDRLSVDRAKSADLTEAIYDRISDLAEYVVDCGSDAVLFTCSAFGPAIEAAGDALDVPVLKPNEAMFAAALAHGGRVGMLVSFQPSVDSMRLEFEELVAAKNASASLDVYCVPEAMAALQGGDGKRHDQLLAEAAVRELGECGVIMLGQFSTARAKAAVEAATNKPVLTSPDAAVTALKARLAN